MTYDIVLITTNAVMSAACYYSWRRHRRVLTGFLSIVCGILALGLLVEIGITAIDHDKTEVHG